MKKSLEELVNVAIDITNYFGMSHFALYVYDSLSYVDFQFTRVTDMQGLLEHAKGLELMFFAEENVMTVRLFEREDETDT